MLLLHLFFDVIIQYSLCCSVSDPYPQNFKSYASTELSSSLSYMLFQAKLHYCLVVLCVLIIIRESHDCYTSTIHYCSYFSRIAGFSALIMLIQMHARPLSYYYYYNVIRCKLFVIISQCHCNMLFLSYVIVYIYDYLYICRTTRFSAPLMLIPRHAHPLSWWT